MNPQPKPSTFDDCTMPPQPGAAGDARRQPGGPRAFSTWPVEFEVEPWRP